MDCIYFDNSATTQPCEQAVKKIEEMLTTCWGNPSSLHGLGFAAEEELNEARRAVAKSLSCTPEEVYFTSGGTESDNLAIFGAAKARQKRGTHIVTTQIEHPAVLNTMAALEKEGFTVTYLDVHEDGIVRPQELEEAITEETGLVTIMYANNEIGTIQPIPEIGAICKKHGVLFHTDAVQAVGNVHIDVKEQNIDMLSLSGHKLHAPKGVGALYIRTGVVLPNFIDGGAQERGKRGGTENVASIVGLATAMEQACSTMDQRVERLTAMRDKLIGEILKIDRSRLNGHPTQRLPGNASFCFQGVEGESLLLMLDLKGISASSGSACTSGSLDPSHVLLALGLPHEVAHGSLRLSFGDYNSMEDIDYILEVLPPIIERLRSMSPLWDAIQQGKVNYDPYM